MTHILDNVHDMHDVIFLFWCFRCCRCLIYFGVSFLSLFTNVPLFEHASSIYLRSAERRKVTGLPMIISNDLARDSMTLRRCAKGDIIAMSVCSTLDPSMPVVRRLSKSSIDTCNSRLLKQLPERLSCSVRPKTAWKMIGKFGFGNLCHLAAIFTSAGKKN
uniref:Uncharacterized protein n=1 Tax=Glossina pallidipes TaxID=7398 RepID=A0A1A9ZI48_GLOPL